MVKEGREGGGKRRKGSDMSKETKKDRAWEKTHMNKNKRGEGKKNGEKGNGEIK